MRELPKSHFDRSLLLRTDFSDENAWEALCEATRTPSRDGFVARFNLVSDAIFADIGIEELLEIQPNDAKHDFLFVADAECLANSEYPILVVDLYAEPGRSSKYLLAPGRTRVANRIEAVSRTVSLLGRDAKSGVGDDRLDAQDQ